MFKSINDKYLYAILHIEFLDGKMVFEEMSSWKHEDNILDQIYMKQIFPDFSYDDFYFHNTI